MRDMHKLLGDTLLSVEEVCKALRVSRAWVYSASGVALLGPGIKIGGSRRYRASVIARIIRGEV